MILPALTYFRLKKLEFVFELNCEKVLSSAIVTKCLVVSRYCSRGSE